MSAIPMYFPPAPFQMEDARLCATLANTAYDMYDQWVDQKKPHKDHFKWTPKGPAMNYSQPIWGAETMLWIFKTTEPFAFVSWTDAGDVYLMFRGTESLDDWIDDAEAGQSPYPQVFGYGKAHDGFLKLYGTMNQAILEALQQVSNPKSLLIGGHSLGSSLSTLATPDIINHSVYKPGDLNVRHYNLASPRVGDPEFVNAYNQCGVPTYRIVNTTDLVPEVPPGVLGRDLYEHVGSPVDFTAQYGSLAGNHSASDCYSYALSHPDKPQSD
ncbi:probable class 3 lipase [Hahella chejuensis KCTC 2396]|uniref:Probable class 3 lipase n=1 Tax=Hahella chejuensis (strain KCTC 2396) TaxID=349521 RepID=Q2SCT6_HAHCH|nr:lipase family protein [Hahella chejuensis]ABC31538.1 probable class 3 lipase [Hahella chejuensis KCTC 2396]